MRVAGTLENKELRQAAQLDGPVAGSYQVNVLLRYRVISVINMATTVAHSPPPILMQARKSLCICSAQCK